MILYVSFFIFLYIYVCVSEEHYECIYIFLRKLCKYNAHKNVHVCECVCVHLHERMCMHMHVCVCNVLWNIRQAVSALILSFYKKQWKYHFSLHSCQNFCLLSLQKNYQRNSAYNTGVCVCVCVYQGVPKASPKTNIKQQILILDQFISGFTYSFGSVHSVPS